MVHFFPVNVVNDVHELKPFSQWVVDENKRAQYDVKARNIISFALTLDVKVILILSFKLNP